MNSTLNKFLMFEIEKISKKEGIEKEVFVVDNPLAGSFKVSNGKITAYIYIGDEDIEIFVIDEKHNTIKKLKTSTNI